MALMDNMQTLLNDLRKNNWHITAFPFSYKKKTYIVLFEDIENLSFNAEEYIVHLTFIDRANGSHILRTKANTYKFKATAKEFREYFGIEFAPNLGNIFRQFYSYFNGFVPTSRVKTFDTETKLAVINKLSHNDKQNANTLCCYTVMRNGIYDGIQHYRSVFNSDKTKLLRPSLFEMLGSDNTISFYYREQDPLDDLAIYEQFMQRYGLK